VERPFNLDKKAVESLLIEAEGWPKMQIVLVD